MNFTSLEKLAERSTSAERTSCHIMGSQGRDKMRKRNFTSLVVNAVWKCNCRCLAISAERKCGSGTSDLYQSRQNGSEGAELQIFGSPVKLEVQKQNFISLTGPYPTDCHCQC